MRYLKLFESFQEVDNPHGGEFNYGNLSQDDITKIKSFIEDLKIYTKENNIKLVLSPEKGVQFSEGGIMCNGYFDDITSTLACALGKDVSQWLVILLHESCHMDQWIEKVPEWTENAGMDNIEKWLGGDNNVNMNNIDENMKNKMNTFCPLPWIHLATRPNGDVRVCCTANASGAGVTDNKIAGLVMQDGVAMNLRDHTIDEVWNSAAMRQTRLQMLNNQIPTSCQKCFVEEGFCKRNF